MQLRQKTELRKLLAPELRQSLNILTLHLLDLGHFIDEELINNPLLEGESLPPAPNLKDFVKKKGDLEGIASQLTKKMSLQDVLLRQLGMFVDSDEDLKIGIEIIGNIDENGFLQAPLLEIATKLDMPVGEVERILKLIQQFEPSGVGARSIKECLLIQLELLNEKDPLLINIVECHLEDVAKKNYTAISRALKEPLEKVESLIKKILKLDPKPGRNYSLDEAHTIIPDIIIDEKDDSLQITINNEYIPSLNINSYYRNLLKKENLDPQTRDFLKTKLQNAIELLRAIAKRQTSLRMVVEAIVEIQQEAIRENLSLLKPLTFHDVAEKLNLHESTVCRVVMNKYVKTPNGIIALKNLFSGHIDDKNGQSVSSNLIKKVIKELIDQEDKKRPLSDQDIARIISSEHNLELARRTVAKYREELKILSSTYRRIH